MRERDYDLSLYFFFRRGEQAKYQQGNFARATAKGYLRRFFYTTLVDQIIALCNAAYVAYAI